MAESPNDKQVKEMLINIITDGADGANSDIRRLERSMGGLRGAAREAEGSVKSLMQILGAGYTFDLTINKFLDINRQMILSTSQFRKYGMGIEKTKNYMKGLSKELSLTQQETMQMMSAFEKGMPVVALGGMNKMLKNIKQVTGSNTQAMQEYLSTFSAISNKFPEMQTMLQNLTDQQGKFNRAAAERLQSQNRLLAMTGKISLAESKAIMDQIEGLKGRSMAEEAAFKKQQAAQDASQKFKQVYEELAVVVGQTILPAMQYVSGILENNSFFIKDFLKTAAKIAPIAIGIGLAFKGVGAVFRGAKGAVSTFKSIKGAISKGGIDKRTEGYKSPLGSIKDMFTGGGGPIGTSPDNAMWVRDANIKEQVKSIAKDPISSFKNIIKRKNKDLNPYDLNIKGSDKKKGGLKGSVDKLTAKVPGMNKLQSFFSTKLDASKKAINKVGKQFPWMKGLYMKGIGMVNFNILKLIAIQKSMNRGGGMLSKLMPKKLRGMFKKIPFLNKLGGKIGNLTKKIPVIGKLGGMLGGSGGGAAAAGGKGIGKALLSGVKSAGPGLVLTVGGTLAKGLASKLEAGGMKKTAGAVGLAGSAAKIGGMALTGAAIGGGPIGAFVGGAIGVVSELGDAGKALAKITGDNFITDAMSGLSYGIKKGLSALGKGIKNAFGKLTSWVKDSWIGRTVGGYIDSFKEGLSMVGEGLSWLGSKASDLLYSISPVAAAYKELREAKERFAESEVAWAKMLGDTIDPKTGEEIKGLETTTREAIDERNANLVEDQLGAEALRQKNKVRDKDKQLDVLEGSAAFTEAEQKYMDGLIGGRSREDLTKEMGSDLLTDDEKRLATIEAKKSMAGAEFGGLDVEGLQKAMEESGGKLTEDQIRSLAAEGKFGIAEFQERTGIGDAAAIEAVQAAASAGSLESYTKEDVASGDLSEAQKNAVELQRQMQGIVETGKIENMTKEKAAQLEIYQIELAQRRLRVIQANSAAYDAQSAKLSALVQLAGEFSDAFLKEQGFEGVEKNMETARKKLAGKKDSLEMALPELRKAVTLSETTMEADLRKEMEEAKMSESEIEAQLPARLEAKKLTDTGYQTAVAAVAEQEAQLAGIPKERIELEKQITAESERKLQVQQAVTASLAEQVSATSNLLQLTGSMQDGAEVEAAARSKIAQNANEIAAIDARIAAEKKFIQGLDAQNLGDAQSRIEAEAKIRDLQNQQKGLRADNIRQLQEVLAYYDAFQQAQSKLASSTKEVLDSTVELSVMTSGLVAEGEIQTKMQEDIAQTRQAISDIETNIAQKMAVAQEIGREQGQQSVAYKNIMSDINSLTSQRNQNELKILETYFAQAKAAEQIRGIQEGFANAQNQLYQSQLQYAALTGNINIDDLVDQYGTVRESLIEQRELIRNAIAEQEQAVANAMADTNASESFRLQQQEKLLKLRAQELDITKKMQDAITDISKAYEQKRKSAQLESEYLQGMVQLQDNLTVGVGASAAMRMEAFAAIGQEMAIMKEEQQALQKLLAEGNVPLEQQVQVENRLKELRNEQLSALQKQNDLVKSLRDGWVSAMTAATNGQGKITKIMVSQEGNLAALQSRFSGIRSSMSGATLRAGEGSIGAQMSQQFTANGGGIPGTAGIAGGTGIGYMSDVDKWLGINPSVMSQQMISGLRGQTISQFQGAIQQGIGTGQSLGLGGQNQQLLNAPGQGGGGAPFTPPGTGGQGGGTGGGTSKRRTQGGFVINCTFNVNTLSEAVTELSRRIKQLQQENTDLRDSLMPDGGAGNGSR